MVICSYRTHVYGAKPLEDNRNVPALGRIGDPDDILASVLVRDSKARLNFVHMFHVNSLAQTKKILPETYQPMPSYRFCTADGVIQLTPGLAQKLQTTLVQLAESEMAR